MDFMYSPLGIQGGAGDEVGICDIEEEWHIWLPKTGQVLEADEFVLRCTSCITDR